MNDEEKRTAAITAVLTVLAQLALESRSFSRWADRHSKDEWEALELKLVQKVEEAL